MYFGLQWTNECFCDNSYNNGYGNNGNQGNCPGGECPITDCDADGVLDDDGTTSLCANGVGNCGNRNAGSLAPRAVLSVRDRHQRHRER